MLQSGEFTTKSPPMDCELLIIGLSREDLSCYKNVMLNPTLIPLYHVLRSNQSDNAITHCVDGLQPDPLGSLGRSRPFRGLWSKTEGA